MVHKFLEKELERPISLDVSIFPVQKYSIPNSASDRRPLGRPVR
ncbi:MAG: hypothetical protein AAFQ95_15925 [Cyanobacteria bacterium J06621_3]